MSLKISVPATAQAASDFGTVETVFLDRDGVINRKAPEGEYVFRWEDFHLLPGVAAAIARLNTAGRRVYVVTNQRGVALGLYTASQVEALHQQLQQTLLANGAHVDGFYFCPHDNDQCDCRKPLPGMFLQAFAAGAGGSAETSVMIGDSLSDIEAGRSIGMRTIFVEGDPAHRKSGSEKARNQADAAVHSLEEAVALLERLW